MGSVRPAPEAGRSLALSLTVSVVLVAAALGFRANQSMGSSASRNFIVESASDGAGVDLTKHFPSIRSRGGGLLVAMGGCSSCTAETFVAGSEHPRFRTVILCYTGDRLPPHSERPRSEKYIYVLDSTGTLHRELRAFSPPRYYTFDQDGVVNSASVRGRNEHEYKP